MRILEGIGRAEAAIYMGVAQKIALSSPCLKSHCGSVIIKEGVIIGRGFNSPPLNRPIERCIKDCLSKNFKSDRHCCVHAEQRAVMDALRRNSARIPGSRLYFARTDLKGERLFAGRPYCTICSKTVLDAGVSEFALWHPEGICVYDTEEYNTLSFAYRE